MLLCAGASGISIIALGGPEARAEQVNLKVGHDSGIDFPYQAGAEFFKKEVEEKTQGRVKVDIFPNAQLGDEGTMVAGLKIGSVDAVFTSTAPVSEFVQEIDILNLPFLFKDIDHSLRVANGPVGDALKAKIDPLVSGVVAGWGSIGERDMWNSKHPIKTLADLKGLKMRTQQSAIQKDTYAALGAQPTPMPFSELFTALQTGVVDGADNGPIDILSEKFYEVTKYLTLTQHFIVLVPMLVSDKALAKLTPEDKAVVLAAAKESTRVMSDEAKKQNEGAIDKLKGQGLEVFTLSDADRKAFVDAVQDVYKANGERLGAADLIKQAAETP
jgi:tripartite ATP-independent transporter DctP family solute receptor